jgi:hypothetical protein
LWPRPRYDNTVSQHTPEGSRNVGKLVPCEVRRNSWSEVSHTLSAWEAKTEAMRCLRCDIKAHPEEEDSANSHEHNLQTAVKQ